MIPKNHSEAIRSLLLLALVFGFCTASLPRACTESRPTNTHPCNKTLQDRRFFFFSDGKKYRCKPFGICSDLTPDYDERARAGSVNINYFLSQDDCDNMCTKAVQCPELSIDNGRVNQDPRYVGYTARYSCNGGYKLVGKASRTCLPSGNWSEVAPTCEVQCTPPPTVANSNFQPVQEYYDVTSSVAYRCNEGFDMIGKGERVCLDNGQWTENQIECSANLPHCNEPAPIDHGTVIAPDWSVGSELRYSCLPNYVLVGPSMRICLNDLTWSRQNEKTFCTRLTLTHDENDVTNRTLSLMEVMDSEDIHCGMDSPIPGSPDPVWMYADGRELDGVVRQTGANLHFDRIVKELEDTYMCRIGTLTADVQIKVIVADECTPVAKPLIMPLHTTQHIDQGETFTLQCFISGCPLPEVRWYHNGTILNISDRVEMTVDPLFVNPKLYILTIKGVEPGDAGDYVCEGNSSAGLASMHIASVTVGAPIIGKRSALKRQLRARRSVLETNLCNLESDTVTMVASVRRPTRKINQARAYSVDTLRIVRGLKHLQSQQLTTVITDSSVRLKPNTKYVLTGRMIDSKLHISDATVHSNVLERALSLC